MAGGSKNAGSRMGDEYEAVVSGHEKDFQDLVEEIGEDPGLADFLQEYGRLLSALKNAVREERGYMQKTKELNGEIVQNAVKVQAALRLSQEDQQRITSLKKEIEKVRSFCSLCSWLKTLRTEPNFWWIKCMLQAWRTVEQGHENGLRAKESIDQLQEEVANLRAVVEKGTVHLIRKKRCSSLSSNFQIKIVKGFKLKRDF
jgi:hypothetical protein